MGPEIGEGRFYDSFSFPLDICAAVLVGAKWGWLSARDLLLPACVFLTEEEGKSSKLPFASLSLQVHLPVNQWAYVLT